MSVKSTDLELYATDDLDKSALKVEAKTAQTTLTAPDRTFLRIPILALLGTADPDHFILNLQEYLATQGTTDTTKDDAQDVLIAKNNTDLASAVVARQAGVSAVDTRITNETTRATGAESDLQDAIDAESIARSTGDAAIQSNINTLVSDRQTAVSNLATARENAATSLRADFASADSAIGSRIDAILAGSDASLDTLKEIMDAFQTADASQISTLAGLRTSFDALKAKFDTAFPEATPDGPVFPSSFSYQQQTMGSSSTIGGQTYTQFVVNDADGLLAFTESLTDGQVYNVTITQQGGSTDEEQFRKVSSTDPLYPDGVADDEVVMFLTTNNVWLYGSPVSISFDSQVV
jgi:hypothetical protein